MVEPAHNQLELSKMSERSGRTRLAESPRFAGYDQRMLRELRAEPGDEPAQDSAQARGV